MQQQDAFLLKEIQQGNHDAYRRLYDQYWEHLYAVAYHWLGEKEEAQEIVQDVFVELWEKRNTLTIHKSLSAYLFGMARYKVFNRIDAQKVRRKHLSSIRQSYSTVDRGTEHAFTCQETLETVRNALKNLPLTTQQIFYLSREQELTYPEIAERMNLSVKSVEYHISKAMRYLRLLVKSTLLPLLLQLFG